MSTATDPRYQDASLPIEERVDDLVSRMTLEEKASQMVHEAPAIPRLGIPEYNWWSECLHGVGRAGVATVFPQAIGLAASFDQSLMRRVAEAISDEARAKHHEAARNGNRGSCFGLTYFSPTINLFRDPRWGRGQETYGEDPYLTGRMGVAFVKGLQGDHPRYLKLVATAKHFAVHSGPEGVRSAFNAEVSPRDLRESYLAHFKACVQDGAAASVMGAYNRLNGQPCCASPILLNDILRTEWGFNGYVVSDLDAIANLHASHKITSTPAESAAAGVKGGCDLNCGRVYGVLADSVRQGLIDEATVDRALKRLFTARFRLGMFDPPEKVPYTQIPPAVVDSPQHRALARQMAQESIVLLKNADRTLPLNRNLKTIAVIGPNAHVRSVLLGNYNGMPSRCSTVLEGILGAASPGTQVLYAAGCTARGEKGRDFDWAVQLASPADAVVAVMGYTPELEGEQGDAADSDGSGDRARIDLRGAQGELLRKLHETGKPVVLVLTGGSPIILNWEAEHIPAILMAWYPGEEGGAAVADVLFGDANPAGRLPVTFVKSLDQVPAFDDYRMQGRTYRFMSDEPLYRFGYGLSYTTFRYSGLRLSRGTVAPGEPVNVSVEVENTGDRAGDEVVQLYVRDVQASVPVPRLHLEGFARVRLAPRTRTTVTFALKPEQLACYGDDGRPFGEPGEFAISVGGGQPDGPASGALTAVLTVKG